MFGKYSSQYGSDVTAVWGIFVSILFHLVFQRFISAFNIKSELESKSWSYNIAAFTIASVLYESLWIGMRPSSGITLTNLSLNLDFNSWIIWYKNGIKIVILNHSIGFMLM